MVQGNMIFLNGTSSSGKTVIAKAIQEVMDDYYIHTGIDHYLERVPEKFHIASEEKSLPVFDGLTWISPDGGKHVSEIHIGPKALRLFSGMYHAYAALVTTGNNIIVDDVVFDPRVLHEVVKVLHTFQVLFVGVRCPLEIAEQREQARGDRTLGLVKAHYDLVHAHGTYDLEVDTSVLSPMEAAILIKDRLNHGTAPDAFQRLKEKLKMVEQ